MAGIVLVLATVACVNDTTEGELLGALKDINNEGDLFELLNALKDNKNAGGLLKLIGELLDNVNKGELLSACRDDKHEGELLAALQDNKDGKMMTAHEHPQAPSLGFMSAPQVERKLVDALQNKGRIYKSHMCRWEEDSPLKEPLQQLIGMIRNVNRGL